MAGAPIFIGFVLVTALLLILCVRRGGNWITNVTAIVVTLSFCFVVWHALGSYRGWPVHQGVPSVSLFIAGVIDEPSQVDNDPGHIDLWLIPATHAHELLGYKPSQGEPRAYREPFSRQLEDAVTRALSMQRKGSGQPVILQRSNSSRGKAAHQGQHVPKSAWRVYRLPPSGSELKGE